MLRSMFSRRLDYLEGQGDLVSRQIRGMIRVTTCEMITHIVTLIVPRTR